MFFMTQCYFLTPYQITILGENFSQEENIAIGAIMVISMCSKQGFHSINLLKVSFLSLWSVSQLQSGFENSTAPYVFVHMD